VKLVISDAHERLKAAAAKVLKATWQRCKVHFVRNALAHAGKGQRQMVLAMINTARVGREVRPEPITASVRVDFATGTYDSSVGCGCLIRRRQNFCRSAVPEAPESRRLGSRCIRVPWAAVGYPIRFGRVLPARERHPIDISDSPSRRWIAARLREPGACLKLAANVLIV